MVERGGEARLGQEPLPEPGVDGERRSDELECNRPVETLVAGEVDDSHAAASETFLEPVAGEGRADRGTTLDVFRHVVDGT